MTAAATSATANVVVEGRSAPTKRRALDTTRNAMTFGQIVSVLARMRNHRHTFLGDLDWLVAPAIATGQYAIDPKPSGSGVIKGPSAVVLWAHVSPEVDRRLTAAPGYRVRLKPEEWASGSIPWLVEAVGEPKAVQALIKNVIQRRFKQTGLKTYLAGRDGKPGIGILRAEGLVRLAGA